MRRRAFVQAAAASATAMVAGCATATTAAPAGTATPVGPATASGSAAASGPAVATATATGSSTSTSTAAGTAAAKPVTVRFQSLAFQDPTIAATKKIVASWNSTHPETAVQYVQGSWDSVHDQLVTQFQGGTAPDVIHDEAADISGFASQGYLADLSPHLSAATRAAVAQGVWDTVTVGGKVVGAPTLLQSYVVFANTALLKKAGVRAPTGATMTWDAFAALAKAATGRGTFGLGWGLMQPTATVMSLGLNFGGRFFTTTGGRTTIAVGQPELEVPRRIHAMAYEDRSLDPTSLGQAGADVFTAFLKGRYAMVVGGNYSAQQLTQTAPAGFTWTVLPALTGTSSAQAADPQTLSVSAQSRDVAAAAAFVDYCMQASNLSAVARGDWLIPSSAAARAAVAASTGGRDGWRETLAYGATLIRAPFQSVNAYPQWKTQVATPALQEYFADRIGLDALGRKLTQGWSQVANA